MVYIIEQFTGYQFEPIPEGEFATEEEAIKAMQILENDLGWSDITLNDVIQLETDPYEGEWYWETWEGILNSAQYTDEKGAVWYLYHDGDLFAVTALDLDDLGDNY